MKRRRSQSRNYYRARHRKRRLRVLEHYGGACECCGETRYEFLAVDHIDGGGTAHRRKYVGNIVDWIFTHHFPPGFRVLCHNCNMAFGIYGDCPHGELG